MKLRHELHYDASPAEVFAMLSDPAFRQRVCDAMDVVSRDIEITPGTEQTSVRIDMVQRTTGIPSFAKKFVGDQTRVIQSEQWAGGNSADLHVEIPGKPGHITGRIRLQGDESHVIESFDGEARINIPLIGGKLEGLIGKLFIRGMDAEHRVGVDWLAGRR